MVTPINKQASKTPICNKMLHLERSNVTNCYTREAT